MTNQVAETCKKAEAMDASEMARTLYMYMADIPSATPMLPLLLKAATGSQISKLLAVNTPNFTMDSTMVIERLQQWQSWYITKEAGRVASEAAKIACLEALHEKFNGMDHNALGWGHVGTTLAIKLPTSFDLKMNLTQADTKEKVWEGILAAVIETELKEDVETITKTCSQMKATSAFPAWAHRFRQMPPSGSMTATSQPVMDGKHSSAGGAQMQVMTTNPSFPARQPPVQMSTNNNQGSKLGIVRYNQTMSDANEDSAMTVMASGLTNVDMQEANEVLSNVFGYPWALKEIAKTKGYWFRTIQREEWEHIARGADAITLRTCSGQDFVIRSKKRRENRMARMRRRRTRRHQGSCKSSGQQQHPNQPQ